MGKQYNRNDTKCKCWARLIEMANAKSAAGGNTYKS